MSGRKSHIGVVPVQSDFTEQADVPLEQDPVANEQAAIDLFLQIRELEAANPEFATVAKAHVMDCFEAVLQEQEQSPRAHYYLGLLMQELGYIREAWSHFHRAVEFAESGSPCPEIVAEADLRRQLLKAQLHKVELLIPPSRFEFH